MSNDKYDAITGSGIEVGERVKIPDELVPADAKVEIEARSPPAASPTAACPTATGSASVRGRGLGNRTANGTRVLLRRPATIRCAAPP